MDGAVSLTELLASRDDRWALEQELIKLNQGKTEIVLTVVMPGSIKRDERSLTIAHSAVAAINRQFNSAPVIERDKKTGYEAYWLIAGNTGEANSDEITQREIIAKEIKSRTCRIEESHPLGRLFDIDVLRPDATPVSRQDIGLSPRRCLICNHEARFCMRNHTHTQEEIQQKINSMINEYKKETANKDTS